MPQADLNLTRTFVAVYETGSVTAAAQLLNLSQPTVTHAVNRLRRQLNDELFIRGRRGVTPTARAHRIYPVFVEALKAIDAAFDTDDAGAGVNPPASLHLALSDAGEIALLPHLWAGIRTLASTTTLVVSSLDVERVEEQVMRGEVDAFISGGTFSSPRLSRTELFREDYVALMAHDHPRLGEKITAAQFDAEEHIMVRGNAIGHVAPPRIQGDRGVRVRIEVPRYSALPHLIQGGELVSIVPLYVARAFAARGGVRYVELPWALDPVSVALYTRHSQSPEQRWFVEVVDQLAASLG